MLHNHFCRQLRFKFHRFSRRVELVLVHVCWFLFLILNMLLSGLKAQHVMNHCPIIDVCY